MRHLTVILFILMSVPSFADVLYIGDSHSVIRTLDPELEKKRFGNVLLEYFSNEDRKISYYAACGATALDWATGSRTTCGYSTLINDLLSYDVTSTFPSFKTLFKIDRDRQFILNLGDNLFSWKMIDGKREASLKEDVIKANVDGLFGKLGPYPATQCVWIGPTYHIEGTHYRKSDLAVDELYRALEKNLKGKCKLIDSRKLVTPEIPSDGLHLAPTDAQVWAKGVVLKLNTYLNKVKN